MSFTDFSLFPELQRSIRDCGYHDPTPVQSETIPVALEGRDLVVSAETGSGKTAAFLIPLIDRLHRKHAKGPSALVIAPKFILLDEPFAGIDPIAVSDIQKIIFHLKERGIGVLITDHNVRETLRITDRAYIVHGGVIFKSGTPDRLADDEEVRRIYLGTEFRLD